MDNFIKNFLTKEGLLNENNTEFVIRFSDGRKNCELTVLLKKLLKEYRDEIVK